MIESMGAPSVGTAGPEAGFNAATANQADFDARLAGMESMYSMQTAADPYDISHLDFNSADPYDISHLDFEPTESAGLERTESGDIIPSFANANPLTEAEIDAMFSGDTMDFTADDQQFLEANGVAARVQTADEQAAEQARRRAHAEYMLAMSIGQIMTDASARLVLEASDDKDTDTDSDSDSDGDNDPITGHKVTGRVPAHA